MPERVQRKRTKGFVMPADAIYVGRPTKWGNPFKVGEIVSDDLMPYLAQWHAIGMRPNVLVDMTKIRLLNAEDVVSLYDFWLSQQPHLMCRLGELRGRNLACWCPLSHPCHADVLLELANQEAPV